jgi:hypothetical protein
VMPPSSEGLRGPARATWTTLEERVGAALLVDARAHEGASAAIAGPLENGLRQLAGRSPDAGPIAFVAARDQVVERGKGAGKLKRDGEEGADGGRGARAPLRGKSPPRGRPGRRGARVQW